MERRPRLCPAPRRPGPRRRAARRDRLADRRRDAAERSRFRAVPNGPVRGMATCRAAGRSSSAATTASSPSVDPARGRLVTRLQRPQRPRAADAHLQRRRTAHGDCRRRRRCAAVDAAVRTTGGTSPALLPLAGCLGRCRSAPTDGRWPSRGRVGVEIVDVATLRRRAILPGHRDGPLLARFTPDGRFLVGRQLRGLGAAVVHRHLAARHAASWPATPGR